MLAQRIAEIVVRRGGTGSLGWAQSADRPPTPSNGVQVFVFVTGFPSELTATNCWVLAAGDGEQCVVVDPGVGVVGQLDEIIADHRLHPVAVLLTHATGTTPSRSCRSARPATCRPTSIRPTALSSAIPGPRPAAARGAADGDGQPELRRAGRRAAARRRRDARAGRSAIHRAARARPHTRLGHLRHRHHADRGRPRAGAVRRRAVRGLGRTHRLPRRVSGADDRLVAAGGADPRRRIGGPAGPRSVTTIGAERRTNPYLQELGPS